MAPFDITVHLLLALVVVAGVGWLVGAVLARLGQLRVIGEIAGGIVLGPSLLGAIAPAAHAWLLPPDILPALRALAEVAVVGYMFVVGLELDAELLRSRSRTALASALGGFLASAVLGAVLASAIYDSYAPASVSLGAFAAFLSVAMAITAFPVLARILADLGLARSELGLYALGSAAIADIAAWCALAGVVGFLQGDIERGPIVAGLAIAFVIVVLGVGRWLGRFGAGWVDRIGVVPGVILALMLLGLSAWFTHAIGIHAVIGAFLAGVVVPADSRVAAVLTRDVGKRGLRLLLPAFFALAGARTDIGLIGGAAAWGVCLVIIGVATVGKIGGGFVAARWAGLASREASALGVLMNTRGLMEIVVLNLGLDLGVISPTLYTMMIVMALVTTLATAPVLRWIGRGVDWSDRPSGS